MTVADHQVRACPGAIGNALGVEIEFWPLPKIPEHFLNVLQYLPPHTGQVPLYNQELALYVLSRLRVNSDESLD